MVQGEDWCLVWDNGNIQLPSVQQLSVIWLDFGIKVKVEYPVDSHYNNSTGEADKDLPPHVILVRDSECWKTGRTAVNKKQVAVRIVNGVA